jgi:hypothetical protein
VEASHLLGVLLDRHERQPVRVRAVALRPDTSSLGVHDLDRFHEELRSAESAGAIALVWGKRERAHLLEQIRLVDANRLYAYLGRSPASERSAAAVERIAAPVAVAPSWILELIDELQAAWSRGASAYGLSIDDIEQAASLLKILAALDRQEHVGLDSRTFSQRATGNSKTLELVRSKLVAVARAKLGMEELPSAAVLQRLGLEKFAQPLFVAGPLQLEGKLGVVDLASVRPFVAVPVPDAGRLRAPRQPDYILTIENLSSFNRQVREVDDPQAIVIYLAGFPGPSVMAALADILQQTSVTFFHWGDIDPGGLRIFRHLEERLPRPPLPHLMSIDVARSVGRPAAPDLSLRRIASSPSGIAELAAYLSSDSSPMMVEQEALDPVRPA